MVRTTCMAFIAISRPCPGCPTSASARTGSPSKRNPAKSTPRIPDGRCRIPERALSTSLPSSSSAEKAPGPRRPVRATTSSAWQRSPSPTSHFSPSST
ncbi:hypothetical protein LUX09_33715 [Streptomyces albogriseolus]|nr:hypothetical protein [Streptomyces albogriseolus]